MVPVIVLLAGSSFGACYAQTAGGSPDANAADRAKVAALADKQAKEKERLDKAMEANNRAMEKKAEAHPDVHKETPQYQKADAETKEKVDQAVKDARDRKESYKNGNMSDADKAALGLSTPAKTDTAAKVESASAPKTEAPRAPVERGHDGPRHDAIEKGVGKGERNDGNIGDAARNTA